MEILVIIVAFWLLLVGAYGGFSLMSAREKARRRPEATRPRTETSRAAPASLGGLFSEVDMLRAQVEHLRTEVVALSETAATRYERARTRRYRTGVYTELPRMLRRHVREARGERHPIGV